MSTDIKHARQLLDHLAQDQVAAVVHVMEVMLDPVSRALANAPPEDEEISAEEEQSVAEAREWLKHNKPIPHEDVLAELGLTMADFERMGQAPLPPASQGLARFLTTQEGDVKRSRDIEPPELRLRRSDYRVRFHDHGDSTQVLGVKHRKDAYR